MTAMFLPTAHFLLRILSGGRCRGMFPQSKDPFLKHSPCITCSIGFYGHLPKIVLQFFRSPSLTIRHSLNDRRFCDSTSQSFGPFHFFHVFFLLHFYFSVSCGLLSKGLLYPVLLVIRQVWGRLCGGGRVLRRGLGGGRGWWRGDVPRQAFG